GKCGPGVVVVPLPLPLPELHFPETQSALAHSLAFVQSSPGWPVPVPLPLVPPAPFVPPAPLGGSSQRPSVHDPLAHSSSLSQSLPLLLPESQLPSVQEPLAHSLSLLQSLPAGKPLPSATQTSSSQAPLAQSESSLHAAPTPPLSPPLLEPQEYRPTARASGASQDNMLFRDRWDIGAISLSLTWEWFGSRSRP
ncbi:MAG TPA: hypothetical protein VD858_06565, partial [Reyranella sp.]|nr:hypothetical protein [Reyranella sp.]